VIELRTGTKSKRLVFPSGVALSLSLTMLSWLRRMGLVLIVVFGYGVQ